MRIIFSRKGFDTGSGGTASPIIGGKPISLPIPTSRRSTTTYDQLGLGEIVEQVTRGRIARDHLCHEDPMFTDGQCLFGQCGAAQSHLRNMGVGTGDVFLFFGLFSDEHIGERHHRIFGYLQVHDVISPAASELGPLQRTHPHTLGEWNENNTIYRGVGAVASSDNEALRLTQPGGPLRHWIVPGWLKPIGLSFHGNPERWLANDRLEIVARGQEFVADIGEDLPAREWLNRTIETVRMTRILRYILQHDSGMAHCIDNGLVSLATCKPKIRASAKPGEWVVGFRPSPAPRGLVVWAGQIAESIGVGEYERRHSYKRRGGRADSIYREQSSGGFERLRPDYHPGPDEFRKDTSSPVLLFDPEATWYFGKEPQLMPEHLMHLAAGGRGHRVNGMREGDVTALRSWLVSVAPPGVHHSPRDSVLRKPRRC